MNLEEIKARLENHYKGEHNEQQVDIDWLIAEVERLQESLNRITGMKFSDRMHAALVSRAEKAEADLAEAEKEIHVRAEGEEKEWERAEKFKAENQRLQERVRDWKPSGTVLKESLMRGLRCSPRRGSDVELSNNETHRG